MTEGQENPHYRLVAKKYDISSRAVSVSTRVFNSRTKRMETPREYAARTIHPATVKSRLYNEINSGLLPAAIRWINADATEIAFERPPQMMTVNVRKGIARRGSVHLFTLPLPWTLYRFQLDDYYSNFGVYAERGPLVAPTDELIPLPMLNVYADGRVCLGEVAEKQDDVPLPNIELSQRILSVVNDFWASVFNMDVVQSIYAHLGLPMAAIGPDCTKIAFEFLEQWEASSITEISNKFYDEHKAVRRQFQDIFREKQRAHQGDPADDLRMDAFLTKVFRP